MRQSGAFFGFFKRLSTSEHGIAMHDRLSSFVELLLDRGHAVPQV